MHGDRMLAQQTQLVIQTIGVKSHISLHVLRGIRDMLLADHGSTVAFFVYLSRQAVILRSNNV